ncbi:MAG TPA: pyrroloquinoline quinone-dependent dehydrogenase [Gemmatimonadaceae bacterium]|nr:pyrroloquinoline quinone-dependent dehydrogenase [Gemmatimonadaceae bacterium]
MMRLRIVCIALGVLTSARPAPAQQPAHAAVEWPVYAHDAGGSRFSPATQITRANVGRLVPVWTYRTGDFSLGDGMTRDETTPLFVDGLLYVSTPFGGVRALDPETGSERWSFDSELDPSGDYGDFTNRGVSTWVDPERPATAACHRRIYVASVDTRLIALDARTGRPCADFGDHGVVRLGDVRNPAQYTGEYEITSPPAVVRGLLIVGSTVADNVRAQAPSGVVRAFDARTGALRWAWDPVPRTPRDSGYGTWRGTGAHETGAANAWSIISVDSARDLVFVPTGSASPDFFGGDRLGANLYANSVVALRASTGAMVWHFQAVHHDLWDYDVPAEPVLFTWHHDGNEVPAVAATTKMGHVFLLDRETGRPLFPVVERPVPASDVPGDTAWPTQPFPTLPAPLVPERFEAGDVFGASPNDKVWCQQQLAGVRNDGIFTPPSVRGTVIYPGNIGGSNWSGLALDPARHLAIFPLNRVITVVQLIPRAEAHSRAMSGTRFDQFSPQRGTPYAMRRTFLIAADGAPCSPPPWGTLTAVDLESGRVKWERPFGSVAGLAGASDSARWGSPNLGGAMITAGGIVFAAGALDQRLHAYNVETGAELWSAALPAGVHASPMTYVTASGRQFVVVAAGGHRELYAASGGRDKPGDYVVAFALPSPDAVAPHRSTIAPGRYDGHMVLDRSRYDAQWTIARDGHGVTLSFTLPGIGAEGHGTGQIVGDSLSISATWSLPAKHCSGALTLGGSAADESTAIIGELEYVDGCSDGRTKPGTFAMWRAGHRVSRLSASGN